MNTGYNNVAFFYDWLAHLVFGDVLNKAQSSTLHTIMPADHILIAGGGSGWILEAISRQHANSLTITFVDAAPKMITKARERNVGVNKVNFITAPIEDVQLSSDYDIVITPFLFDNFTAKQAAIVFDKLHHSLRKNGKWLFTDFRNTNKTGHTFLLRSMYYFFGLLCGLHNRQLPDTDTLFEKHGYKLSKHNIFMNEFVTSQVYDNVNK